MFLWALLEDVDWSAVSEFSTGEADVSDFMYCLCIEEDERVSLLVCGGKVKFVRLAVDIEVVVVPCEDLVDCLLSVMKCLVR